MAANPVQVQSNYEGSKIILLEPTNEGLVSFRNQIKGIIDAYCLYILIKQLLLKNWKILARNIFSNVNELEI